VDVPTNPDDLTDLISSIITQDAEMNAATPGSSPISAKDITALKAVLASAKPDRDLIKKLQPQVESAEQRSLNTLGLSQGQTVRTDGTGLFLVTKVRDRLLAEYKGNEKELEGFGYPVVIAAAATAQRQPAAQAKKAE
jgi:hypothetical protein